MLSDYDFGLIWSIYVHYMWWDDSSNGFCEILRNIDEIPYDSHWLQCFRVCVLFQISYSHTVRESVYWFEKPMKQRGMKSVTSLTVPTSLVIETILVMWRVYTFRWIYGPVVYAIHIQVNQVFLPKVLVLTTHSFLAPYLCVNYVTAPNNWWRSSQVSCWETVEWQSPRHLSNGRILTHPLWHHIRHSVELFCCEVQMWGEQQEVTKVNIWNTQLISGRQISTI